MNSITVKYNASVMVAAGWRSVVVTARVEQVSAKMGEVIEVIAIDGEPAVGYQSRTGAKRQRFNAAGIAKRELGKKKRLSACWAD